MVKIMEQHEGFSMRQHFYFCSICLFSFFVTNMSDVVADVVRLKNGGEVRGQLEGKSTAKDLPITIRTLSGAVVEIDRAETEFVQRRSQVVEEYITRSRAVESSVEAHWQLAQWCRIHLLKKQRLEQLEMLLEIDPDHKESRRILRHVQHNGHWVSRDEMMTKRGYVKHKNKWITTQELALIEKNTEQREAELVWYPKVRLWLGWLAGNNRYRRNEGLKAFKKLQEPDAIPALMKLMATHADLNIRQLYVRVLANTPGERSVEALLDRYLFDINQLVRIEARGAISTNQNEIAVPMLISALANDSNMVVRRAAVALGEIGDETAVPALISALITTHRYKVQVSTSQPVSFGSSSNGRVGLVDPRLPLGAAQEVAALARLGQLPYGARVIPYGRNPPKNMQTVTLKVDTKNPQVLTALESLTDKKLGYNERDWHLWWSVYKT